MDLSGRFVSLRLKIRCSFCDMKRYAGTPGSVQLPSEINLPEVVIVNTMTSANGKFCHYNTPIQDFRGSAANTTRKIQRKVLKNYRARAEELIRLINKKLERL